jgi:hypothetical protein
MANFSRLVGAMTPDRSQLPTIGHIRTLGMTGFVLDCLGVYCHHTARIEFDALQLPNEMIFVEIPKRGVSSAPSAAGER